MVEVGIEYLETRHAQFPASITTVSHLGSLDVGAAAPILHIGHQTTGTHRAVYLQYRD